MLIGLGHGALEDLEREVRAARNMSAWAMALGGWMSGAIFDLTGSYRAAFLNGIA